MGQRAGRRAVRRDRVRPPRGGRLPSAGGLGDEKLSYLGYSYGTQLGAVYAEAFPQNVRAMALDGAIDPDLTATGFHLAQLTAFQKAFERYAVDCATSTACPLGNDPARATEKFQSIVRPLLERPATTTDGRGLDYVDAVGGDPTAGTTV